MLNLLMVFPDTKIVAVVVRQLARSATSIGANYREANRAESKGDFIHKIGIVTKETAETVYWLEVLLEVNFLEDSHRKPLLSLLAEARELHALFQSISRTSRSVGTNSRTSPITQ